MNIKSARWAVVFVLTVLLIYFGFKRELYLLVFDSHSFLKFLNRYPRVAVTDFKKEMSGMLGFSLSPKLTSSILFSLIYTVLASAIIYFIFLSRKYARFTAIIYISYMIVCYMLIMAGNAGVDYRLSYGLSHYLEDLFLSPFPLMLLIPAFYLSAGREKN
jgi:hypothetical protein